jgi:hypothetical protein
MRYRGTEILCNQEKGLHQTPDLQVPWPWLPGPRIVRNKCLWHKPPS